VDAVERIERQTGDFILILLLVLLAGVGISLLFSGSYAFSGRVYDNPFFLVSRQILFLAAGTLVAVILSIVPLELFRSAMPVILLATLVVSLLPFVPGLGVQVLGSRRWISMFGLSLQPSELMKLSLVLYLSSYFSKEGRERTLNELIPPFIVIALFSGIIYMQNDYSTAVFILLLGLAMLFIVRVRLIHFFLLSLFAAPISVFLLFTREHRVQRLLTFLGFSSDPAGAAYQIANSQSAFVSGGLWGKGLGRSAAKLGPLPMAYSDFIYAVIGEETGFFGALFVLALFGALAWRGYRIAWEAEDGFHSYLAFGVTTTIVFQALLNMTVAVGLVPTTGITLPFFSAGGSSLAITLAMCGLLANVSRRGAAAGRARGRRAVV
jgi:cell division protein FtsW